MATAMTDMINADSDLFSTILPSNFTTTDQKCSLFDGDEHKCSIVIGVKRAMATLSLLGCLFIIGVIWLFKKWTIFPQKLILYLTIAALFSSIMYIIADMYPPGGWCTFQAFGSHFFDWSVLLWVCCITFNLFMNAVRMTSTEKYEWAYHLVCWGIAGLMSVIPLIAGKYGPAGVWCWIVDDWGWRFGTWYFPLFVIIVSLFCTYTYITVAVNRKVKTWEGLYDPDTESKKQQLKEDVKPLRWYPCVFLVVSLFGVINRIQNAASPDPIFALVLLHAMFVTLLGVANAIVFGLDKDTRSKLSWAEVKIQLRNRFQKDTSLIREYPANPDLTMQVPPSADYA